VTVPDVGNWHFCDMARPPAKVCFSAQEQTCDRQTQDWTARSVLTASGRRRTVSYVASGCEDIDL
jgi:hypothetical protein